MPGAFRFPQTEESNVKPWGLDDHTRVGLCSCGEERTVSMIWRSAVSVKYLKNRSFCSWALHGGETMWRARARLEPESGISSVERRAWDHVNRQRSNLLNEARGGSAPYSGLLRARKVYPCGHSPPALCASRVRLR